MPSKVLVIDNNLEVIHFLEKHLKEKGFEVNSALTGKEGLEKAKTYKPDVIILDILNPEVSGFETLKKLKSDAETANIPVILDSIVEKEKESGLKLGAVDFLSKPLDLDRMYLAVENVIDKKAGTKSKAVLVVDDDEPLVEMTKDFLEQRGLRVFGALTGVDGISIVQKENIGLIILDLRMPGMDGYEFIKMIKGNPLTCDIPIIVLTSVELEESREKCLILGAEACYTKPCDGRVLINEINLLMERTIRKDQLSKEYAKARILIADDEEIIRELIKDTLEMEGYEVIIACDGREALDKIYSEGPDILILDVKMPYLSGFEVCQTIREDVLMNNLPIIMLTAKASERDEIRGLELGVDDYLRKPFRPAVLVARVRAAFLRMQQGLNVNPLTYLPGNTIIAREIERRLKMNEDFAVLYIDIDRFKSYNDFYGFHKGDEVIKATARILVDIVKDESVAGGFIGHVGGDDFICITNEDKIDFVCRNIIRQFDSMILNKYNKEDVEKGHIVVENRKGEIEEFPVAALSIGVVMTKQRSFSHIGEISRLGSELKKYAKKSEKSNYVLDRRTC